MQLTKQNHSLLFLTLNLFSTPICLVTSALSGTADVGQCHGFAAGLFNTSDLALDALLCCLWTCTAPRAETAAQVTAGSFIADALVVSPALFPAFEASVIRRDLTGACFPSMKPIESALNNAIDFLCVCMCVCFASNATGFSHLIPLELGVLFFSCNFLFMHCFCPAVVCYSDTWFLFFSFARNKGWWESNADRSPSPHYCTFWGCGVVCICRRDWWRIQETWSQDMWISFTAWQL